ncbi:MAG: SH3 domain-containing protein [Bdellovibrionota bacterium]
MLFVILSSILLSVSQIRAATIKPSAHELNPKSSLEVPFYKSTSSLFPSGTTSVETLKKLILKTQHGSDQLYQWNKLYFSQDELKPLFAVHLSQFVIDPKKNKRYKVVETTTKSLQLFDTEKKLLLKKNINEVKADNYDMGYVMALKDIYLRSKAQIQASVQTTIPQGTRLVVENYNNEFALVKYQSYEGYVHLSELITKFDFATFVYAQNEWHQVKNRQYDKIISVKNISIPLNSIKGLSTPEFKGIIASTSQKIPLWSQVEVVREKISVWNQSHLKDHGPVWWKPLKEAQQIYYTIDELLKKDISSVSFHPQNPLKGILSSDGVFITENGYHWRKLEQFENFNGPVHYFNDLLLFVGNFRSTTGGQSFDNYIQIDKLASAIEYQFGFSPKKLQVKKIETRFPFRLKIEIETGVRKIKMESPLFAQDWKATKS